MGKGAIDNDFDEAELAARERLLADAPEVTEPAVDGLAIDLVTHQLLFVYRKVADDLASYYEVESFDLLNYGVHPYLPVTIDDSVFKCVYLSDVSAQKLDAWDDRKTYDFPSGRLARVPVEEAWGEENKPGRGGDE